MNNDDINYFIKHFLEKDHTNRALMMSGEWGSGKSHYIKNSLVPFLLSDLGGSHKCIIVSLYGLSTIADVSKEVFLEAKMKWLAHSPTGKAGYAFAKTIIKSISGKFGFDLKADENDLKDIYDAIDLSGKLVIFEDVERTQVDLLQLLGYVNSLVEQDGVKVLLVTNEKEIIKYDTHTVNNNGLSIEKKQFNEQTVAYLRVKEKTVGDTIAFECNYIDVLQSIFLRFQSDAFKALFCNQDTAEEVCSLMRNEKSSNFRSVIYACQKTADIIDRIQQTLPHEQFFDDFYRTVFYGIICYSLKADMGLYPKWKGNAIFSFELGSKKYPLFRFCFEYLRTQQLDDREIILANKALKKIRLYDPEKSTTDKDVAIISDFMLYPETDVKNALSSIRTKLIERPDSIAFAEYGRIGLSLVIISSRLDINTDDIQSLLVSNLRGHGDNLRDDEPFLIPAISITTEEETAVYSGLCQKMVAELHTSRQLFQGFEYKPEQAEQLLDYVKTQMMSVFDFFNGIVPSRLASMFNCSTPSQMQYIRDSLRYIFSTDRPFRSNPRNWIESFIAELQREPPQLVDGICKLHYSSLLYELNQYYNDFHM